MARPGELDFAKLAADATKELNKSEKVEQKKVKVAASEGGVPSPEHAQVDDDLSYEDDQDNDQNNDQDDQLVTPEEETSENEQEDPNASENVETTEKKKTPQRLSDDDEVVIKIDGEEQTVTYKQYKDLLRKEATITQRMQNFAKSRDEFNAEAAKILQQLEAREAQLSQQKPQIDPVSQAIIDALQGKVKKERNPNEVLTYAEVQEMLKAQRDEFENARKSDREQQEQALVNAADIARQNQAKLKERQQFNDSVSAMLNKDEYKIVNELVPHVQAHIWERVHSVRPATMEEALEVAEDFVKERLEVFKRLSVAKEQVQQKKAAKQKMESNDGSTVTQVKKKENQSDRAKKFVLKNGKLDFKAMALDAQKRLNDMN